jgi:hypothetical protein
MGIPIHVHATQAGHASALYQNVVSINVVSTVSPLVQREPATEVAHEGPSPEFFPNLLAPVKLAIAEVSTEDPSGAGFRTLLSRQSGFGLGFIFGFAQIRFLNRNFQSKKWIEVESNPNPSPNP